jgi:hypothetical protein
MKLNEIFDTEIKHRNVPDYQENGEAPYERYARLEDDPTAGLYSQVKPTKNNPFTVTKTTFDPVKDLEKNDGYFYYINEIKNSKQAPENPYFPRVYEVRVYKDSQGRAKFKAQIETLIRGDEVSEEELKALGERIFEDFDKALERNASNKAIFRKHETHTTKQKYLHTISMLLNDSMYHQGYIKDPHLKAAAKFIDDLQRKNKHIDLDIHDQNFLFRRGKYGIQLVITDPFRNM